MEPLTRVQPIGHRFTLEVPTRIRGMYDVEAYEPYSTALFARSCRWADVVVDIGAHVGFFGLVAAHAAPGRRVVAVEASPENAAVARRNLSAHPEVELLAGAFGAEPGSVLLHLTEASDNCTVSGHPRSPTIGMVEVPIVTGADLRVPPGGRVLVKMDIDGHELEALDGLDPILHAAAEVRMLVEFNPSCTVLAGHDPADLVGRLLARGLRLFALDERAWHWSEVRGVDDAVRAVGPRTTVNLYAVPAAMAVTVSAVLHSADLAGAERSHVEIVDGLVAAGCMVHTVVPEPDLGLVAEVERAGSSVTVVPATPWWATPTTDPTDPAAAAERWRSHLVHPPTIDALRAVGADVVLTQTCVIPQGALAAAVLGWPHVWWVREYASPDYGLALPLPPAEFGATMLALSDTVVVNSPGVERHFFPDPTEGVVRVPYRPCIGDAPTARPVVTRPFTIGVVGALQPGKRHRDAVEAVAFLAGEGRDVRLVCVGHRVAGEAEQLLGLAAELGIADQLSCPGFVADRARLYADLDLVVVTSPGEATSRVPFESTAAGIPVVYVASGGPAEYMTHEVTGLACAPQDPRSIADAVRRLMDDPELAARLVAGARARFAAIPDPAVAVRDVLLTATRRSPARTVPAIVGWLAEDAARVHALDAEQRARLDEVTARLAALERSRIWRVTAPYRSLADRIRRRT